MRYTFKEIKQKIKEIVPDDVEFDVDLEAGTVAITTFTPKKFTEENLVGKISKLVKRSIVIRPNPSIMLSEKEAEKQILQILPQESEVTGIFFDACFSEVLIECKNPGVAVGKKGVILNEIRDKIGWLVEIKRTPPLESKTVHDVRGYRSAHSEERRKILKEIGLNIFRPQRAGMNWVRLTALGSYREVGRACHYITTNESRIMIDVGVNIASDTDPMPFFNAPEALPLEKLDAIILTHSHLDHAGMLPVLFKYGYKGPVYCTPPTRDMMLLLQSDYLKVTSSEGKRPPYEMEHVREAMKHVIDVDWGVTPYFDKMLCNCSARPEPHNQIAFAGDFPSFLRFLFTSASINNGSASTII